MKALLVPIGSRGDVQPQLVLGEELARRGHEVTIAAPPNFGEWVREHGFAFLPVGQDIQAVIRENSRMTEQHPVRALPQQLALVRRHLRQQARDLLDATPRVDVVVTAGLGFAGTVLAQKLRVPHLYCSYTLSGVRSAEYPPAIAPLFGLPRLANRALWRGLEALFDLAFSGILNEARHWVGLPPERGSWISVHARQVLLAQDSVMGELPSDVPAGTAHVPALVPRPEAARPLSDLLERFLRGAGEGSAAASPVVYLGFGSMPSTDRARVMRIARELFEQHSARVILYSAHAEDAGADLPPGVFLTGDTDHQSLFPRVDLIVHHGGAGTTAAALRSGVPQLVVPHIVDQFFHGRRVAELGVGPAPVAKSALSTAAVAQALDARFRYWAAAQRVRAGIRPEGGAAQAADHLEHLVAVTPSGRGSNGGGSNGGAA